MKKIIAGLTAALLVFGGVGVMPTTKVDLNVLAVDITMSDLGIPKEYGDYTYHIIDYSSPKVIIDSYKGSDTDLIIPETINDIPVVSISPTAFNYIENPNAKNIKSITLPQYLGSTTADIADNILPWLNLENIFVSNNNQWLTSENGVLYNKDKTSLICYPQQRTEVIILDTVKAIADNAFAGCKNIKSVTIPNSVQSIGSRAFIGCEKLEHISIPKSVTYIGSHAFDNTPWLSLKRYEDPLVIINGIVIDGYLCEGEVTIPDNVTAIGDAAFSHTTSPITSINMPNSIKYIGKYAFSTCKEIESITLPKNLETISKEAFSGCTNLKSVTFSNSVKTIEENAFMGCTSLESIELPEGLLELGSSPFLDCKSLKRAYLPGTLKQIPYNCFYNCKSLEEVVISKGIETIDSFSFGGCSKLKAFQIPYGVTMISYEAFFDIALSSIVIPKSVIYIGEYGLGYRGIYNEYGLRIDSEKIPGFTVYGYAGTDAQRYAEENGFTFVPLEDNSVFGDIDGDGDPNVDDVLLVQQFIAGWDIGIEEYLLDINSDGLVSVDDAILIQQIIAGWDVAPKK